MTLNWQILKTGIQAEINNFKEIGVEALHDTQNMWKCKILMYTSMTPPPVP